MSEERKIIDEEGSIPLSNYSVFKKKTKQLLFQNACLFQHLSYSKKRKYLITKPLGEIDLMAGA